MGYERIVGWAASNLGLREQSMTEARATSPTSTRHLIILPICAQKSILSQTPLTIRD